MKITDFEILTIPDGIDSVMLVVVDTDEGVYGLGEVGLRSRQLAVRGALEHLREVVVGADATRIEDLWQRMARGGFFPVDRVFSSAIAAIDVALWDIRGKALGVPVYQLLGGRVRDYVSCYAHAGPNGRDIGALRERCLELAEQGWRHLRIGVPDLDPFEPRESMRLAVHRFHELRDALGDDAELIIDVHTRFDLPEAVTLCREIEAARPFFVEDPLRAENTESYRMLRSRTGVPLAAGEQFASKWEFRPLIEGDLIDYARIDVAIAGGLTEARKILASCETHHIRLAGHNPLSPVTAAATLHLGMACPVFGIQEHVHLDLKAPLREVFTRWPRPVAGRLAAPAEPGLGVDIDRAAARALSARPAALPQLRRADGAFTNW